MGEYKPLLLPPESALYATWFAAQLTAIEGSINTLATNIDRRSIPVDMVNNNKSVIGLSVEKAGAVAGIKTFSDDIRVIPVDFDGTLARCATMCMARAVGSEQGRLYHKRGITTTAICSALTYATAKTLYEDTSPTVTEFKRGDVIIMRYLLGGGESVTTGTWHLTFTQLMRR